MNLEVQSVLRSQERGARSAPCRRGSAGGRMKTSCVRLQLCNPTVGPRGAWFCWSTAVVVEMTGWYRRNVMSQSCRGSPGFHLHNCSLPDWHLTESSFDSGTVQVSFQPALPPSTKSTKKDHNFSFFSHLAGKVPPTAERAR